MFPECSTGTKAHEINDDLERNFLIIEGRLALTGGKFGLVSVYTGFKSIGFGLAQIVGTVFFCVIRTIQALFAFNTTKALFRLKEARQGLTYFLHGAANILRGVLEILQISAIAHSRARNNDDAMHFKYEFEKAWKRHVSTPSPEEVHHSAPSA